MHESPMRETHLHTFDFIVNFIFIGPLVVFYWRGTWALMDIYLVFQDKHLSAWISFGGGNLILILAMLLQKQMLRINTLKNSFVTFIFSRLYLILMGLGGVNQWRGVWLLQDEYTGVTWLSGLGSTLFGFGVLMLSRSVRSSLSPPLVLYTDIEKNVYKIRGRFSAKVSISWKFVGDVLFTSIVTNTVVVVAWRGVWTLFNVGLFPEDILISGLYSLLISYGLAFFVLLMRFSVFRVEKKLISSKHLSCQILLENIFLILSSILCITHWRGFWLLQDAMLLSENPDLSAWISHLTGTCALVVLLAFRSVVAAGCLRDHDIMFNVDFCFFELKYTTRIKKHFSKLVKKEKKTNTSCAGRRISIPRKFSLVYYDDNWDDISKVGAKSQNPSQ